MLSFFFIKICAIEALERHVLHESFQVVNPAGAEEVCFEVKSIFCPYFFLAVSSLYPGVFFSCCFLFISWCISGVGQRYPLSRRFHWKGQYMF